MHVLTGVVAVAGRRPNSDELRHGATWVAAADGSDILHRGTNAVLDRDELLERAISVVLNLSQPWVVSRYPEIERVVVAESAG